MRSQSCHWLLHDKGSEELVGRRTPNLKQTSNELAPSGLCLMEWDGNGWERSNPYFTLLEAKRTFKAYYDNKKDTYIPFFLTKT